MEMDSIRSVSDRQAYPNRGDSKKGKTDTTIPKVHHQKKATGKSAVQCKPKKERDQERTRKSQEER
jgi:hypothetical protein